MGFGLVRSARRTAALAGLLAPAMVHAAAPEVQLDTGTLRGAESEGMIAYKGIPFAQPPVGPLRWRAPQPLARWSGVRDATRYGHDCMQLPFPSDAAPLGTAPAEDCLYANVWRPSGKAAGLPVLVWIYGGGFVNGGASPPTYAGAALAREGIVFVSFNYRLGRFGSFGHPQLAAETPAGQPTINYGYMDQLAALKWVQRNVAAFGGDPSKVTIVGESAGGISVHQLVTSPLATGLFRGAVVQSGGPIALGDPSPAAAAAASLAFARGKGIADDDPQALAKLRALPADAVVDGLNLAHRGTAPGGAPTYSGPAIDGVLAVDSVAAYRAGRFAKVPMMVGATSDDIGGASGAMVTGASLIAGLLAGQAVPAYLYRFSYVASSVRTPATKGASHASDIPFFFDTADVKYGTATTATDRAAARTASGYLVNFVKTGDPNGGGLTSWPRFAPADPKMVDLDAAGGATLRKAD